MRTLDRSVLPKRRSVVNGVVHAKKTMELTKGCYFGSGVRTNALSCCQAQNTSWRAIWQAFSLSARLVTGFADTSSVGRRLHRLCGRAGIAYRPFTALWSSSALRLWQRTHDPRVMVERLGIGSLKSVEAYARMKEHQILSTTVQVAGEVFPAGA